MGQRTLRRRRFQPALVVAGSLLFWLSFRAAASAQCTGCQKASFGPAAKATRAASGFFAAATAADLQGFREPDLILTTEASFSSLPAVVILYSVAPGQFGPPVSHELPNRSQAVVAGDFTGDGQPDILASSNGFSNELFLLRGTMSGFEPAQNVSPGTPTFLLASGDFDGDGRLDAATTVSISANAVRFLFGNGAGGFSAPLDVPAGPGIASLTTADFNADGRSDVIATNQGSNTISVILGVATPPFAPATNFVVGTNPFSAGAADFNSDGKTDIAVSNLQNRLTVLFGTGTGTFLLPTHLAAGPGLVSVGDIQGDGHMDVAVLSPNFGSEGLWELASDGTGAFAIRRLPGWRGTPVAADFTRDGRTDIAVLPGSSGFAAVAEINLFLIAGAPSGLQASPATAVDNFATPGSLVSADFNGDTRQDLAVAYNNASAVQIYLGTGVGTFLPGQLLQNFFGVVDIEAPDVTGDGSPDLVVLQSNQVTVFVGNGAGQFGSSTTYSVGNNATSLTAGDLNIDSRPDLVVSNGASNSISVLLGTSAGTFLPQSKYAVGQGPSGVVVASFDADAYPDLAVTNFNTIAVLLGDGTGGFRSIQTFDAAPNTRSPVAADFNADGNDDVAVLRGDSYSATAILSVFPGNGIGQLGVSTDIPLNGPPSTLVLGDLNQDAAPDLFVAGATTGMVFINSGGTFLEPDAFWIGEPGYFAAIGDFVSNGLPDIAVSSNGSRSIVVLPNTNCRPRALLVGSDPYGCIVPSEPFQNQPVVFVQDDGGNTVSCDINPVTASIVPGTGAPGAILQGTTSVAAVGGSAVFSNLSVDRAGTNYQLAFIHPFASPAHGRPFSTVPDPSISAAMTVCPLSTGNTASVAAAGDGAIYTWIISNGVITSGAGTPQITFRSGPFGQTTLGVLVVNAQGCPSATSKPVGITASGCPSPVGFFTVEPCRLVDTRMPAGPFGGPPLSPGGPRYLGLVSRCGIPATAKALAINVTVDQPGSAGHLTLYAGGTIVPSASTLNYRTAQTRANNAILALGAAGDLTAECAQPAGTVHLILDVTGYFE